MPSTSREFETRTVPRIGYVVKRYPRYSETFIVNEILAHEEAGIDVFIFSLRPSNDTHFQNRISQIRAPVHYLPSRSVRAAEFWNRMQAARRAFPDLWRALDDLSPVDGNLLYQAMHLAMESRRLGIDHLHAHFANQSAAVARIASRCSGIPYSLTAHAKDIFHEAVDPHELERKLADAAWVVAVSDFNRDFLRHKFGHVAERVERVYNGLDPASFPYRSPHDRGQRIVAVGRLVEKKGFAFLIEACKKLIDEFPDLECDIVGEGDEHGRLSETIDRLDLREHVKLAGALPLAEVAQRVQQAAVLAAPCVVGKDGNRDGLPTVLLEAMALGTPCVSTHVTGIPEIVRDDDTGLLVPPEDVGALAAALRTVLTDPLRRERFATNGRALVEQKFNIHANARRLRQLFGVTQASGDRRFIREFQGAV